MSKKPSYEELEQRIAEIEESQLFFKNLLDMLPELVSYIDKKHKFKFGNRAYKKKINIDSDSMQGLHPKEVLGDEAFQEVESRHNAALSGQEQEYESTFLLPNGEPFYFHAKYLPHVNDGQVDGFLAVVQDITERKQAEDMLNINLIKYQTLFESLPIGITISDKAGNILESNNMAERLLKLPKEEHVKRKIAGPEWRIIRPDGSPMPAHEYASVKALKENRLVENVEMGIVKREGDITWITVTAIPIPLENYGVVIIYTDITERKRTEEALQKSEAKYKSLIDNMTSGVAVYEAQNDGEDFTFLDINQAGERIDQIEREEVIGRSVTNVFPGILKFGLLDVFKRVWRTGKPENYPITLYKDQRISGWRDNYIYKLPSGELVAIYSDETLRKKAEEALKKSEEKYREFVEGTDDLIAQVDHEGRLTFINHKAETIFGLSKEKCIGMSAFEFIHPDDRDKTEKAFSEWVRNRIQSTTFENRQVNQTTGKTRHMHWTINIQYDKSGNITGVNNIARDLTEKNRIENELRKSEERYHLATLGGNVGVWDWNLSTGDMFISPNLKALLGYDDSEIKNHIEDWGKHVYVQDVEAVMKAANACIDGSKEEYRAEHRMVHKDGSLRWFLASGKIERDEDGRAIRFLGANTDITQLKDLEEKLRQMHKMDALGTLSGGIAHEFNNLLGIIIGNTELAIDDVPEWNPAKDCLEEIRTASLRAKDVVRQIMSFSRKTPASRKPIKVSTIIQESLKLMRATIPTNIDIRQEILYNDEMILANPTEVNQILMNLCSNSVHAIEEETGVLKVRLETTVLDDRSAAQYEGLTSGEYVKLTVKDNGSGIDPKLIGLIFDPYFTTKDVDKGLGMGLAVVYGIVKKHDGAIRVNSKVGKGTTVEVLFPITEEIAEIIDKESQDLPKGAERILFVDDETSLVKLVKQMLERQGYEVVGKTSSTEALNLFQEEPDKFDLVITDMAMPDMTGGRLAQELIKIRPTIPVIICTGHSDRMDEGIAMKSGIAAFTMKPLVKTDLVNTVRRVLDKSKDSTR